MDDGEPSWSPNGSKIAYTSTEGGNLGDIHVMNSDGSGTACISCDHPRTDALEAAREPAWSPDGSKIAYGWYSTSQTLFKIRFMNADGSDPTPLTNESGYARATWSPDGTRVATYTTFDRSHAEVAVASVDGSDWQSLLRTPMPHSRRGRQMAAKLRSRQQETASVRPTSTP